MALRVRVGEVEPAADQVVARAVFAGLEAADGEALDRARCQLVGFRGERDERAVLTGREGAVEVLVGLGAREAFGREALRRAGAAAVRALPGAKSVAFPLVAALCATLGPELAARSLAEGAALAAHRFTRYRSSEPEANAPEEIVLVPGADDLEGARRGAARAEVVSEAVGLARDLVNTAAADLGPEDFSARAAALAETEGLECQIYDEADAREAGLGGLLGVGAGSVRPPRLCRLRYRPEAVEQARGAAAPPRLALVGKGITFDSGGLSLKTPQQMLTMKTDMSGAAAVLATMVACRRLAVAVEVVGYLALADNMPSGSATRPGDVLRIRNGKTIEVLNTDAEGRLVLADALSLAVEDRPDAIIDLATLTGACVVALGRKIAGLLSNDRRLAEAVRHAGLQAGEPAWPLPLPAEYRALVDSEVADLQNQGSPGQAGTLTAGLILQEFVGSLPWAHLDIAGPARAEEDGGYLQKGGTGFGVRTLIELLEHYEPVGGVAEADPVSRVELP
ncbi:MAG: leucyl aminopeptidase [Actinomycetota bacterium]|nr:leucyl aminopeptidase [Actinomycetota bacterium]